MRTPASIGKLPLGLWIFSLVCDLISLTVAVPDVWRIVAFYSMVGGLIGALVAAVPGLIDLLYYKGGAPPFKNIALTHMVINLSVVVLYAVNIWLRIDRLEGMNVPIVLSAIGVCAIAVSGWLGGQMVHVYGVGVEDRE
jgi:uncharacterized membrane protein